MSFERLQLRQLSRRGTALILVLIVLLTIGGVWASYRQRAGSAMAQHRALVDGCERSMDDRFDNVENWWGAYVARRVAAVQDKRVLSDLRVLLRENPNSVVVRALARAEQRLRVVDRRSSRTYLRGLQDMIRRVDRRHSLTVPDGHGGIRYPLGVGQFSCERAYPLSHVSLFGGLLGR